LSARLMQQLAAHVNHGDHLCVVCENAQDRLNAAAQYIADGLARNELVVYAADTGTTTELRRLLVERGVDVAGALARGALRLPTAHEAYLRDGRFDPDAIYAEFEATIAGAAAAGFTGCRFAGEPVWAIERAELRPGLIEFEHRLNGLFRGSRAAGLCVYQKEAWPAEVVRDVLRTHPAAVVGDQVCKRNLYYGRADLLGDAGSAEFQVAWMLEQLRELQTQEARLQLALEAGRLGSWELDVETDTSVRSLRHDQIFGYERPIADWGYERFMQHVLPEDREGVDRAFRDALQRRGTWHFQCRIRRHGDDAIRWIEAYGRPEHDSADGPPRRLLGIVADITERKEMEEALREADRRKDEFLATLAHELRNPLAPIVNAVEFMRLKAGSDEQLQRMHDVIDRQVHHLGRLVDDLMDLSRISTGRIVLRRQPVALRTVLASAYEASMPLIDAARQQLTLDVPDAAILLDGDPTRLSQVFCNILNNASKYTPVGGGITLTAHSEGGEAVVRVADTGAGIAPELLPHIFRMFVQGHRSGERAQGGLGIGLPLAKQLVELHGGTITARSDGPGRGSEFTVRLPLLPGEPVPGSDAATPVRTLPVGRGRIVVVDDNTDAADTLCAALRGFGYETWACYDGAEALRRVDGVEPEIVVLDIGLPGLDGYEVARRLRARGYGGTLVALTGWGQEGDLQRAHAAGFDLHRTKPVNPAELATAIAGLRQALADA